MHLSGCCSRMMTAPFYLVGVVSCCKLDQVIPLSHSLIKGFPNNKIQTSLTTVTTRWDKPLTDGCRAMCRLGLLLV